MREYRDDGAKEQASGPIPKFATTRGTFSCELRNLRTTSNSMISSAVLNLKFLHELAASYDRNFKFPALVGCRSQQPVIAGLSPHGSFQNTLRKIGLGRRCC